jgi:hypothetical protein
VLATHEGAVQTGGTVNPALLGSLALCHNDLAFHTEMPAGNWAAAEEHFRRALDLFSRTGRSLDAANVELNLQTALRCAGKPTDAARVRELTGILEQAGDVRAANGHALLKELSAEAP